MRGRTGPGILNTFQSEGERERERGRERQRERGRIKALCSSSVFKTL